MFNMQLGQLQDAATAQFSAVPGRALKDCHVYIWHCFLAAKAFSNH
jgi:hypothetical protein